MKRILVVDESQAVRDTIAFVLRRDFLVAHRAPLADFRLLAPEETEIDLLVLGVPPGLGSGSPALKIIAARVPCPLLLLVTSRALAQGRESSGGIDYLAKPFHPYELKEKVTRLLGEAAPPGVIPPSPSAGRRTEISRYLDFPYLPASTSRQAKNFALSSLPILILGEVGSGHEKVARALHSLKADAGLWFAAYAPEVVAGGLPQGVKRLLSGEGEALGRSTLFLFGLEALDLGAQASLLAVLQEAQAGGQEIWLLSASRADLVEKVYRGEFLDSLYYRLATLALRLPPLRERQADLPALAARLAEDYGERLGCGEVVLSPEATERLSNYLWFGNLEELETVIARTLAARRKALVEGSDLILGEEEEVQASKASSREFGGDKARERSNPGEKEFAGPPRLANGDYPDIRVLINELAHELKNPMVTIKTFTQLLDDRYDDEAFRDRFQETVGNDIDRMDDLLETLLDFSRFNHPARERVLLYEQLHRILDEILPECIKRETAIRWGRKEESTEVFADRDQLHYVFTNVLRAVLSQVKRQGEIQVEVGGEGTVAIAYVQEGGQMNSLTHYLELSSLPGEEAGLPLRILLAKIVLQRLGGGLAVSRLEGDRILIRADLPVS
ncbi:MAG: sigma 54-interacting transcriptional regulator [Deltaproteobacteria bacterium]|nr:sigma 54-interacting transcriptional regulator [Deltaproteobacteria bacterium]